MPTPDGREWLKPSTIADRMLAHLDVQFSTGAIDLNDASQRADLHAVLTQVWTSLGYETEFKILRLTEKLKDSIVDGSVSRLTDIKQAFLAIYTADVLDLYDEDGQLLVKD